MITTQDEALSVMLGGDNTFVSGVAGTGKSYLVNQFVKQTPGRVDVTASTGIAALNVRGMTLHRWCGMGLGPRAGESFDDFYRGLQGNWSFDKAVWRIEKCKRLVIDEVSMLQGRTLDFVNFLMKRVRGDKRPFGGVQVIAVGDFLQLAPVRKNPSEDYDWAFSSQAWKEAGFTNVYLKKIWRQDEPELIDTLNQVRAGEMCDKTERTLKRRVVDFPDSDIPRLMTHNAQVDNWNSEQLIKLKGPDFIFEALEDGHETELEFLRKNLVTPKVLTLRLGACVMIAANSAEKGYVNGMLGHVAAIEPGKITVITRHIGEVVIEPNTWTFDWQNPDSATFKQFPLRLAYGMTIHKAQGLTLEHALIDIRAAREPGQAYVALSRVKSLKGLYLSDWFKCFFFSKQAKNFYAELK